MVNLNTIQTVAPTETERSGLTKESQYATVRSHAKDKHEKPTEMFGSHLKKSKVCCRCKKEKPLSNFYRSRAIKDGFQRECKSCHSKAQMKWQNENRNKANEIAQRYSKGRGKAYYQENAEKIKAYQAEYHKKWWQENKDKRREYKTVRRARKYNSNEHFTQKQFRELCQKHGNKCLCCKEVKNLQADHIVPIARGGSDGIENIQPLCKICNIKKGTKTIDFR